MFYPTRSLLRRFSAMVSGVILGVAGSQTYAGTQANVDKELAQQAASANPFPLHFALSVGGDDEFVFRGVEILPEVNINVPKALVGAINGLPEFKNFLATNGLTAQQFVALTGAPLTPVKASRESGLYYVDGNMSATLAGTSVQLGAFYGTQSEGRVDHNFFGTKPIFDSYREFDAYLSTSRAFGPVRVSLGGTFYHVINNSDFDTAELNFGVTYTPPQFQYVSASFSYNYAAAFAVSDYKVPGLDIGYLDGHYLELRIDGNVPLYKQIIKFQPYILVSAGSGIVPRTFNPATLPTFFNTKRYSELAKAALDFGFQSIVNGSSEASATSASAAQSFFDPNILDRSFDLSNFQAGFRVPFYLTRYITIRGDFNYSRPLGNLERDPYDQKDQLWGGGTVTFSF